MFYASAQNTALGVTLSLQGSRQSAAPALCESFAIHVAARNSV